MLFRSGDFPCARSGEGQSESDVERTRDYGAASSVTRTLRRVLITYLNEEGDEEIVEWSFGPGQERKRSRAYYRRITSHRYDVEGKENGEVIVDHAIHWTEYPDH